MDQTRTVPSFDDEASRGIIGFLKGTSGMVTRGAEQQESPHVDWLPAQTRNPLGMAFHSIAHRLSRLRVPYSNVSVVSTGSKFPFPRLPLDAEDPPFVSREDM